MTVSYSKHYDLLGKYVSFKCDSNIEHVGVIDSVSFYLDDRVEIGFANYEFFDLSQISNFKILGQVLLGDISILQ